MTDHRAEFGEKFRARLRSAIDRSGLTDREVSIRARGPKHPKTVTNIFSSGSIPGADIVQALAVVLDVSADYLLAMPNTVTTVSRVSTGAEYTRAGDIIAADFDALARPDAEGHRPPLDTVLAWWRHNERRLIRTKQILDYCDIYRRPSAEAMYIQPLEIGPFSLAGQFLKSSDVAVLQEEFKQMPKASLDNVIAWHLKTAVSRELLSMETLVYTTATGVHVTLEYARLLLAVTDADGSDDLILCYARPFRVQRDLVAS